MLVNLKTILEGTREDKRAVGSFNVYSYETIQGVAAAVKKADKDAIISFGASYLVNMSLDTVVAIVKEVADSLDKNVALHLDHCNNIEIIKKAIDAGFGASCRNARRPHPLCFRRRKLFASQYAVRTVGVELGQSFAFKRNLP